MNVSQLHFLVPHAPPLMQCDGAQGTLPAMDNRLLESLMATGNHWRKIINCAAKTAYLWQPQGYQTWQNYRDDFLLRGNSQQFLHWGQCDVHALSGFKIITGKQHGQNLLGPVWQEGDFYLEAEQGIIVSPYFDYRQLSNLKIQQLVGYLQSLNPA